MSNIHSISLKNVSQISLFNISSECLYTDRFANWFCSCYCQDSLSKCTDYTFLSRIFTFEESTSRSLRRFSISGGERFDSVLGLHQRELQYPLYNTFNLPGRSFSYGSFILKIEISEKYLFIFIIQYPCPKYLLKNINVRGQTLTILKPRLKSKCRMYLKSFTCPISLSLWTKVLAYFPLSPVSVFSKWLFFVPS